MLEQMEKYVQSVLPDGMPQRKREPLHDELFCHLLDRYEFYREIGFDDEESTQKAIHDMGEDEDNRWKRVLQNLYGNRDRKAQNRIAKISNDRTPLPKKAGGFVWCFRFYFNGLPFASGNVPWKILTASMIAHTHTIVGAIKVQLKRIEISNCITPLWL